MNTLLALALLCCFSVSGWCASLSLKSLSLEGGSGRLALLAGHTQVASIALPAGITAEQISTAVSEALWTPRKDAVVISVPVAAGRNFIAAFLRNSAGDYISVDISDVEKRNLGKLGNSASTYNRIESTPFKWLERQDGLRQVLVITKCWERGTGQRYRVSEPLIISADGTPLWS